VLNEKATSTLEESLKLTVNTMAEEISTLMEKIEKMQRGHEQNQNLVTAAGTVTGHENQTILVVWTMDTLPSSLQVIWF
jgi:hypothetical protein